MKKLVLITMIGLMTFTVLTTQSFAGDKTDDCPASSSCSKRCDANSNKGIPDEMIEDE